MDNYKKTVIKRNGEVVPYEENKIRIAIEKAFTATKEKVSPTEINAIVRRINVYNGISVEDIQTQIEYALMTSNYFETAKAFILYRAKHAEDRMLQSRLDYMEEYTQAENAATGSETDANANVTLKNVANQESEVWKKKNRQLQRRKMKILLKKLYPEVANDYVKDIENHIIYINDEASSPTQKAYTYSPFESVEAVYNGCHYLVGLKSLYNLIQTPEVLEDSNNEVWCKYPNNLQIMDKDSWVKVARLTRKKRHRDLYRVKTAFGEDIIVTDNHPMIVSENPDNTVIAINSLGEKQFRTENKLTFDGITEIDLAQYIDCDKVCSNFVATHETQAPYYFAKRFIKLDRSLGYVVGFFIGDGNYNNSSDTIAFSQKERDTMIKLEEVLFESLGIVSYEYLGTGNSAGIWRMNVCSRIVTKLFRDYFGIKDKASNKCLPLNLLTFNEDFAFGIIEGLIDSDGNTQDNYRMHIRLSSRECIMQLTKLLRHFGYNVTNIHQGTPFSNNTLIKSNYDIWGVQFTNQPGARKFDCSYKWQQSITKEASKGLKYSTGWSTITNVHKINNGSFLDKCEFIYDITTESGTFDCNNLWVHNCSAVTLYPLMLDGTGSVDGVTPGPPNDIQSFSGQITNLVFLLSSQVKGAVALGSYFIALNYYVIQEFGEKWYELLDKITTTAVYKNQKTVKDAIRKGMKQFIYGVNQPAGNRSYNSPFSNISFYDKIYFNSLFEEFYYPDGTKPEWKAVDTLQRIFMELHRELRLIKPLTFPVTTLAMVHDNHDIIDKDYKKLCAEEWAKGGSFFAYISNNASALASCCFSEDTKFLWKSSTAGVNLTSFKEFYDHSYNDYKENFKVYHNGSWVKGKVVKLPNRHLMYKVTTFNNKEFYMTDNHINITLDGEKDTQHLTTDDYLMFNTLSTQAIPENNEHLTYAQGFAVGAFLGDGSFGGVCPTTNTIYNTAYSQNINKYEQCAKFVNEANYQLGKDTTCRLTYQTNNVYRLDISSKELVAFIQKWTNWKPGTYSYNKQLNLNCLLQSTEFRRGILDGWYNTDGRNTNRCYTTSPQLAEDMEILIMSLGMQSIINISDRTDEDVVIKGEIYNRNYPLYCVRWYELTNQRTNKDSQHAWIKKNNSLYFRIKSIERIAYDNDVYCVECDNCDEPYFTLPCGLITHNCRVLNEVEDNTFSSTIGLTGIMTGSCNVITLNLNRIIQNFFQQNPDVKKSLADFKQHFKPYLTEILERVYKYHIAYKSGLYEMEEHKMFTNCNAGYIYIKKLYSTIGLLGYCEAAQFLGLDISNNQDYKDFLAFVFGIVKEQNKQHSIRDSKHPYIFNSEAVPGENMAVKFYQWDKADGYWVPEDQNLYSSYFFKQWDKNISVLDKLKLHGRYINESTDGGQACHIHLNEHLSAEQYTQILDLCIKEGVNYFTFNIPMSECKDCGHTVNAPIHECPKCGSKNIDWWVRIIGFLRPISAWSKERQIEASKRIYSDSVERLC